MRKFVLFFVGFFMVYASAFAIENDVIYLSDTNDLNGTDGKSALYRVEIDEGTSRANLSLLPGGLVNYNHVDALAAEQDGSILWMINSGPQPSGMLNNVLAAYVVADGSVDEKGQITGIVGDIDQATVSPSGTLYVTSKSGDKLYTVNKDTAVATEVGTIGTSASGGDIAFDQYGTLYLVNQSGLYELALPLSQPGAVVATLVGTVPDRYTGLAIRANGLGDLIGSNGVGDAIRELSAVDAAQVANYPMYKDASPFDHGYGDMTTGTLVLCTKTIGYWKNHDWNGAIVYINGSPINEGDGRGDKDGDLWNAKGKTYSMLYAQLIAAKLNTNNAFGIPVIDAAETFLVGKVFDDVVAKSEKSEYSGLVDALSAFNEDNHCED